MRLCIATLVLVLLGIQPAMSQGQPGTVDTEVLARGPVHEAFAKPIDYHPKAGSLIAKKPPETVEEQPPDQKPNGHDVRWLPGYWAWDTEGNDYIWISGIWRDVPPGQRWVPGSWTQVPGGWQWSPGFWAADEITSVNYVPAPPAPINAGPSIPAAQLTDVFVPGCWVWRDTRFLWRPGYWVAHRPDWVWIPAHYIWTPGGYIFVEGHWDLALETRGLLFAPVRFLRRGLPPWIYTPRYVVQSDFLLSALFVVPTRHHYYFGDYFAPGYEKHGFVAWIDYRPTRFSYDPCYTYYRSTYHKEPAWERNLHHIYQARFSGQIPRPPHTFVQQERVLQNLTVNKTANVAITNNVTITNRQSMTALVPLGQVHHATANRLAGLAPTMKREPAHVVNLQSVTREQLTRERKEVEYTRQVAQKRRDVESKLVVTPGSGRPRPTEPLKGARLDLSPSPIERPKPAARPPLPTVPRHEERKEPGRKGGN